MADRASKRLRASGHLVDSGILKEMLDAIIREGGSFEITRFEMGRTNLDPSELEATYAAPDAETLDRIARRLTDLGVEIESDRGVRLEEAPADGVAPAGFYTTTHHETHIMHRGQSIRVEKIRMDGAIVVRDSEPRALCVKGRDLERGDPVVIGLEGIRVAPEFVDRDRSEFGFMTSDVSSERVVRTAVDRVATAMRASRRTIAVAGPVVVHTGGAQPLARLIEGGFVHGLLAGNALAAHDLESQLFGTSLGIEIATGEPVEGGNRHHLWAINEARRAGSIAKLVDEGRLKSGVMHAAVRAGIPVVLAGSIRDDGPLPETLTDMNQSQAEYARVLEGADLCLMLASMLHSIAVANMIPARVKTVCVDIHPAVVTKLRDRGSRQAIGIVTDVGFFLHLLADRLCGGASG
jgi:lysine-ketoglutarate reductase/saccharopine dehydrogenase-like protein (TIGR00300 family)